MNRVKDMKGEVISHEDTEYKMWGQIIWDFGYIRRMVTLILSQIGKYRTVLSKMTLSNLHIFSR